MKCVRACVHVLGFFISMPHLSSTFPIKANVCPEMQV